MKRSRSPSPSDDSQPEPSTSCPPAQKSPPPHKPKKPKLKQQPSYVTNTESPFPGFTRPTPQEALEVHQLLEQAHPDYQATRSKQPASSTGGCGGAPNVIEALIDTILSQHTSAANSSGAKASLDAAFGRNNFAGIAAAPRAAVVAAIRQGGLANKKAATIQGLLHAVRERHGAYSLQHLAEEGEDGAVMRELVAYDGVGPKTASCVLLFCLGRDSFAVDTHVFRLSRVLGWVPPEADRVRAQAHLDWRIPGELKYGLHVLMVRHGRTCKGCKKAGSGVSCPLKTYVSGRRR